MRTALSKAVFELLKGNYALAVARADAATEDRRLQARSANTGIHLLTYYWHGLIGLDTPDGLLRGIYRRVPATTCDHFTSFISRSLRDETAS
ncbi:hypothetical protein [Catenulispora sp. GP43]|uniref:hypothetical protein n=1 Tax=Catenulispora sp. GP43 TaxID=3156263 RepID=UPI0035145D6B